MHDLQGVEPVVSVARLYKEPSSAHVIGYVSKASKKDLQTNVIKYLDAFKNKPYIFNLGHGVLPNTDPSMVDYLVKLVKDYS